MPRSTMWTGYEPPLSRCIEPGGVEGHAPHWSAHGGGGTDAEPACSEKQQMKVELLSLLPLDRER